jgi:hypothetical protein
MDKLPIKLPVFKANELKHFKFTIDQYITLEKEYNRYMIYKETIKNIENLLKISNVNQNIIQRRVYENKSIIDRFVLECINHGISPYQGAGILSTDTNMATATATATATTTATATATAPDDLNILSNQLFLNPILGNESQLKDTIYFRKMISEYIEKKFKYIIEKVPAILKVLALANSKFIKTITELNQSKNKYGAFADIPCCILVSPNGDNYIIRYRTYSKVINFYRYIKLIKNYNRPFPYDIIHMILRYALFDMSNQQWSIGINLYDTIATELEIGLEMFASPLNFNMNMFCSIFLDTDKTFGSIGSFYNLTIDKILNINMRGVFYNPPYLPLLMENTTKICLEILTKLEILNTDFTIVSFLPNWADADYIQAFIMNKYCVYHKVMQKGEYILHEKDKGKLIRGTFDLLFIVLNSIKPSWNDERAQWFDDCCKNIVKIMKEETIIQTIPSN